MTIQSDQKLLTHVLHHIDITDDSIDLSTWPHYAIHFYAVVIEGVQKQTWRNIEVNRPSFLTCQHIPV